MSEQEKKIRLFRIFAEELLEIERELTDEEKLNYLLHELPRDSICHAREIYVKGFLNSWNCLNCYEHGFPVCEIECDLQCNTCKRYWLCKREGKI